MMEKKAFFVPDKLPMEHRARGVPANWAESVGEAQNQSAALVLGVFSTSGEMMWSNRGMQIALHVGNSDCAPCDCFVNPTFQQLAAMQECNGIVFEGLITLSNRCDPGVSLKGHVYRQSSELLVVCEYDVMELARFNNELATMNREINNLQRALMHEKRRLEDTLAKLRETQAMLVHSEKMNALGQLVAGVAHEINNPIAFVYSNLYTLKGFMGDLLDGYGELRTLIDAAGTPEMNVSASQIHKCHDIEFITHDLEDLYHASTDGLGRVKNIVENLRTFARLDEAELKTVSLAQSMESTLALVRPKLHKHKIDIQVCLGHLPPVTCFASELNQVFLNLILNAIQAMDSGGTLCIRGTEEGNLVKLEFTDSGCGILPEIQDKIFDPFFTTKPVGQGTGLGLSLAYKIIAERHHGTIHVVSEVKKGTTFTISIPKTVEA